jgi:iron complex transport system ATP-binding protein
MIVAEAIEVRFGSRVALRDVSLELRGGTVVAMLGRNAVGKTTLLRALAGLQPLAAGRVLLDGRDLATWTPPQRAARIAVVVQRPFVGARFTVRETVALGRFSLPADPERVERALADVGLLAEADRPIQTLSVGQQQRASLARAMAQAAPGGAILLDEPFSAMDLGEIRRSLDRLRGFAAAGGVVVAALHDVIVAAAVADRVIVLEEGTAIADGPASELLAPDRLAATFGVPFVDAGGIPIPDLRGYPDRP